MAPNAVIKILIVLVVLGKNLNREVLIGHREIRKRHATVDECAP